MSQTLIQALQNPALFDHPVDEFQVLETHISWVILTGSYAYKIKKPMDFGFLDFSTLENRLHFCQEELRLNRRLAPDLYLELLPITGDETLPTLGGEGKAFEYAIKMQQFEQTGLLNNVLERGELTREHIDDIAATVSDFHQRTESANADTRFGEPAQVMEPVQQNFEQIRPLLTEQADLQQLDQIEAWAQDTFTRLTPAFEERKATGHIKACHGDLHLGNITLIDGKVTLFDCIEFNEDFYWIDVIREVAFLVMDLEDRGEHYFANHFLNTYLELSGDYAGLAVLNFYKSYYAMVRAKVGLFQLFSEGLSDEKKQEILTQYRSYTSLAERYMAIPSRCLLLMHGYSGTGKSTVSNELMEHLDLIRLRSDVIRKRLFGEQKTSEEGNLDTGIYSHAASDRTFDHLRELAHNILATGNSALIDATFLKAGYRDLFHSLVEELGVPHKIISCQLDDTLIRERLRQRQSDGQDASDAGENVYEAQLASAEPLTEEEQAFTLTVDTSSEESISAFIERIDQITYRPV